MLNEDYFIHIKGWVIQDLKLKGYEAMCFGLIEGITNSQLGYYKGGQEGIAEALGISRKTANELIAKLEAKGFIEKSVVYDEKLKRKTTVLTSIVTKSNFTTDQSNEKGRSKVTNLPNQSNERLQYTYVENINNNKGSNTPDQSNDSLLSTPKAKAESLPPVAPTPLPWSKKVIEAWYELCKMPKWKNKPKSAIDKVIKKLSKYPEDVVLAAIEDAIMGNYQGIFPDKFAKAIKSQPLFPRQSRERVIDIKDIL